MSHQKRLTIEEVETYVWGFVVIMVTLILCFIVVALLYSVTFVTQPIKSMAPIDMAYTKMLNDIVLLIVGGIGGVIGKKGVGSAVNAIQSVVSPPPTPTPPPVVQASGSVPLANTVSTWSPTTSAPNWLNFKNPDLDESWTPPPPPTTPPDLLEDDHEREHLAMARKEVG